MLLLKMAVKSKNRVPEKVLFSPDEREKGIIEAAYEKLNHKKAQDVISAALLEYAESKGLQMKAS